MVNVTLIFRERKKDGIYNFTVVLSDDENIRSSEIGYCVVNLKNGNSLICLSSNVIYQENELANIRERGVREARQLEETIFT